MPPENREVDPIVKFPISPGKYHPRTAAPSGPTKGLEPILEICTRSPSNTASSSRSDVRLKRRSDTSSRAGDSRGRISGGSEAAVVRRMSSRALLNLPPSMLEQKGYRFLILHSPTDDAIGSYVQMMMTNNVSSVCRVCEPTYDTDPFTSQGIQVYDMAFEDGYPPTTEVLQTFLRICRQEKQKNKTVAVHCVGGLGRAPALVCIALMELCKMKCDSAVRAVRSIRRGAINDRQLAYLERYSKEGSPSKSKCCIM